VLARFLRPILLILTALAIVPAQGAEITAEQVRKSIERGKEYLLREQNPKTGAWDEHPGQAGAITSLCALALLNAGVEPEHERIQLALKYLRTFKPEMTYATSLQTMVFCAAGVKADLVRIRANSKWLEEHQIKSGEKSGAWSYPSQGGGDNSNSQFALLALYEAERVGVPVAEKTWRLAYEYWKDCQNENGSWGYLRGMGGSGSMTCAGIAAMVITSGELNLGDAEVVNGRLNCCGEQKNNLPVERGLDWLGQHFSVTINPGAGARQGWLLYYLYGVERVGRMTARRFIGKHDWYRAGAEKLVRDQDTLSGFWKGVGHAEDSPQIGTSLALLFLAKGRRPVLVAKVKHAPENDWNHHRGDLANLTSYVEKKWNRDLTWQIVDIESASVEDLLLSPVLFINGREAPVFTAEQKQRLRDYVDRGGFIFAEACCGGGNFDAGFRQLMNEIFPGNEYKLKLLPPSHPVWHAEETVRPEYIRELWGIDVGCRTSVVYCPQDLSCQWELARPGRDLHLPKEIQEDVAAASSIGINVLAYATNKELKYKYQQFQTPVTDSQDKFDRGKLYVANIQHPGGCNAAPGALGNLLRLAGEKQHMRVSHEPRDVTLTDPLLFNYMLAFMHGRHSFRLTPQERKQLKLYLEDRGGVLLADAICSNSEFAESFRREMKTIFPDKPLERIPVSDPIFSSSFGGVPLTSVSRRVTQAGESGQIKAVVREGEPYLEGIRIGDRMAVIFSPYDLSCALESREAVDCEGYVRTDAAQIGLNVILYSLHQ
jgi:Domain of unknown function (DUF4159)